jgi:ubiquinone biosynthesis protein
MGISLKPQHLVRYKDIAWLLIKYGHSDLVQTAGLEEAILEEDRKTSDEAPREAKELASDLERMGPTFIKLGQLLSTRPDMLPLPYIEALARLQDKVEPFAFEEVERIVNTELGVRLSKAFAEFDREPMAAASLGQVHRAVMRDGRRVAVKVQRPNIREQIVADLEALEEIAEFVDNHTEVGRHYEFTKMLGEFRKSLLRELDYRQEAQNLLTLGDNLREFDRLVVPQPVGDYTTSRVLTMQYVAGRNITSLSPLVLLDIDGQALAEQLFRAYLKQILVDGFFHADPHPGNVFLTDDGRLALLDLGMVAHVSGRLQELLLQLLLAISEGRSDDAVRFAIQMGETREGFNESEFASRVTTFVIEHRQAEVQPLEVGRIVLQITRLAGDCGIRLPSDLTMLAKTLLNLDQVGWTLDPNFDPNAAIRRNAAEILRQKLMRGFSPGNVFSSILEMRDLVQSLPRRVNKILEQVANNDIEVKVNAIDETKLMAGFQKVANRITMGLVLAALIVGAAMLMQVPTSFRIFGYPGLAMLFFLVAAAGGIVLVINILFRDE